MDMTDVATRLTRKFGLGSRPEVRQAFYQRLEDLVLEHGELAYVAIASAAADSIGKEDPGRYFTRVATLRLRERGLLQIPDF